MVVVGLAAGCGAEGVATAPLTRAIDLSEAARQQAVIEAATQQFEVAVKAPFLVEQGMTVRGLARAATKATARPAKGLVKTPADLHASRYDPTANASAKLELINGKVVYTAVASADDASGAVLSDGHTRWVVSYEVEAMLTPDGELKDFVFHRLGEARRSGN